MVCLCIENAKFCIEYTPYGILHTVIKLTNTSVYSPGVSYFVYFFWYSGLTQLVQVVAKVNALVVLNRSFSQKQCTYAEKAFVYS